MEIQKVICSYLNIQTELRVPSTAGEVSHLAVCGHWNENNAFKKQWKRFSATAALLARNLFLHEHDIFKVSAYKCKQALHFLLLDTQIISKNFFLITESHYIPAWHRVLSTTSSTSLTEKSTYFVCCLIWSVLIHTFLKKAYGEERSTLYSWLNHPIAWTYSGTTDN